MSIILIHPYPGRPEADVRLSGILSHALADREGRTIRTAEELERLEGQRLLFALPLGAEGVNLDGKEVVVEGEELMARCIQHECDHLEGHLYLDRLDRKNRAKAMKELRAQGL